MTTRPALAEQESWAWLDASSAEEGAAAGVQRDEVPGGIFNLVPGVAWPVALFLVLMVLPTSMSFYFGALRLTTYRIFLLVALLPCLLALFSGRRGRVLACDWLIIGYVCWTFLALMVHHGFARALESGGIYIVEVLGAYLVGRCFVRDARTFRGMVAMLTLMVIVFAIFTIPESVTGTNFFGQPPTNMGLRLGLSRARATFEHPIHYGVFCGGVLGLAWYAIAPPSANVFSRIKYVVIVFLAAATSLSAGPAASMTSQIMLAGWEHTTRTVRSRWLCLAGLFGAAWVAINILSNRTPMKVFLTYFTFSSHTAYNRLIIWEWGTRENVAEHPILGIGFNVWVRPEWMHSTSMDNFWLHVMVTFGLPAFFLMAAAILYLLIRIGRRHFGDPLLDQLRKGWIISILGVSVAAATCHLWNMLLIYFCFLIGAGVWMAQGTSGPSWRLQTPEGRWRSDLPGLEPADEAS